MLTEDGSPTVVHPDFQVKYHSTHGALAESRHVFIESGLRFYIENATPDTIRIFEMGFGTGLNALLTYRFCSIKNIPFSYLGIEKYLIDPDHVETLNFSEVLKLDNEEQDFFYALHRKLKYSSSRVRADVREADLLDTDLSDLSADVVFYDAFGPRTQPDLWSQETMELIYSLLRPEGVLTTFCAQGQFRRNLKAAGFQVEKIPGPPGKRDMTRAIKP